MCVRACTYACMYVRMHICMYIYIYTHIHARAHAFVTPYGPYGVFSGKYNIRNYSVSVCPSVVPSFPYLVQSVADADTHMLILAGPGSSLQKKIVFWMGGGRRFCDRVLGRSVLFALCWWCVWAAWGGHCAGSKSVGL